MEKEEKTNFTPLDRWLVGAFLLGPVAWLVHLLVGYTLVPQTCEDGSKLKLHALTGACVVLTLIAGAMGVKIRNSFLDHRNEQSREQTLFLATCTIIISMMMALIIIAQDIPQLILRSCD